ncbi:hypothetical protein [Pedobacter aquatilis]|uniref:hypothetical protein n=1 Tax=Pedobacter aquatilis TaxID=351343 RepID=UPI00292FB0FB|nr:hypothetical protein [Pedobacter aquatilis]
MSKLKQAEEKEKKQERENQRTAFMLAMPCQPISLAFISFAPAEVHYPIGTQKPISAFYAIFQPPKLT